MKRTQAREYAFNLIYEATVQKDKPLDELLADTEAQQEFEADKYIRATLKGVSERTEELNGLISENAHGWKLSRISATSGAILRLAIYEMLYGDVPFSVAINEAVELAKRYDHEKAPKFINGILNSVAERKGLKPSAKSQATAEPAVSEQESAEENG